MAIKILQIDLQNDITPQIGSYDNAGGVTPNNWRNEDGVYSLGPTNGDGKTPYYWFTPTREVTDFDLCWEDYQDHSQTTEQYHLEIGDSAGNVVLSALRQYANYDIGPVKAGNLAYRTWHKILVEVRKASASSSTVTVYVDGRKVATGTSNTLLTSAKIALLGHVPNIFYMQNAGQRLRYVTIYDRSYASKGINLDGMMTTITALISKLIAKLSTVALTGSYNDLSDKPTIPTVNNATLTIQRNGTTIDTFTANASVDKTININTADDTKIPLAGSNAISGDLIPSTDGTVNLGGSSYQWNNAYIKSLTINGVACGDILTHNASEFVDVSSNQTIGGVKTFSDIPIVVNGKSYVSKINANRTDGAQAGFSAYNGFRIVCNNDSQGWNNTVFAIHIPEYSPTNASVGFKLYDCIEGSTSYKGFLFRKNNNDFQFSPTASNAIDLGASTNKWKSFNGINPGALSLQSTNLINIASSITSLDGVTINKFTPQVNGWLLINGTGTANDGFIYVVQGQIGMMCASNSSYDRCAVLIPVVAGVEVSITCKLNTLTWANIAPCQGNV